MATQQNQSNFNAQFGTYALRQLVDYGDTVDIGGNRSQVRIRLQVVRVAHSGDGLYNLNPGSTWAVTGSKPASGSFTYDFRGDPNGTAHTIYNSGFFWVDHDPDGTKTITVGSSANGQTPLGSASISAVSITLPTIPRFGERWDGSSWVPITIAERFDGSVWVPLTVAERWTGTEWKQGL